MHVIETLVDIIQFLVVGNELVYPEGTLEVICMSAAHSNPASISIKKVERKEKRTIYNTGHLGPSLDTTECGSPPYSTGNQLESMTKLA